MFSELHEGIDYPKLDAERIKALQAENLPHVKASEMLVAEENPPDPKLQAELLELADKYFHRFVRYREGKKGHCINCDRKLTGQLFGGTFTWGLAHGEGSCGLCGYPARAIHRIEGVGYISNLILQYHPDGLSFDKKEGADGTEG